MWNNCMVLTLTVIMYRWHCLTGGMYRWYCLLLLLLYHIYNAQMSLILQVNRMRGSTGY